MSSASIITLAVAAGELASVESVDDVLRLMTSNHHDVTWLELMDALLDQRNYVVVTTTQRRERVMAPR